MVIFRENSEDIYAGIEYQEGSEGVKKLIDFLVKEMGVKKIRFPDTSGIGIKPVSREGTERLVRKAIQYAIDNDKPSVTIVHKGSSDIENGAARGVAVRAGGARWGGVPEGCNMNKKIIIATVLVLCAAAAAWYANRPAPADGDLVLYGNVDVRQVSLAFNGSERIASL
eukprot:gene23456-26553_t